MSGPLLILGAGASGMSAARLAAAGGCTGCVVSETPPSAEDCRELEALGFRWQDHVEPAFSEAVLSPGFPVGHPWLNELHAQGVPLIPEFEWAAGRLRGTQIAVTGSLGKTSMVLLAELLLRDAGYRVAVSGNIGTPVSETARRQPEADFHLLELSSFQLEAAVGYRPDRALCLNLFPNHLDRHADLQSYAQAKARLFAFQGEGDLAVWPLDFPVSVRTGARRILMDEIPLPDFGEGPFAFSALRKNLQGLMGVLQGIPGVDATAQAARIREFSFPPHRMQALNLPGAGRVIDDSKSTCLTASAAALEAVTGPVQLVMGGLDKAEPLEDLMPLFQRRKPSLYLFGAAAKKMQAVWKDSVDLCRTFDSLDELMPELWKTRTGAQTLLFSPGCASFDQFSGYAARGQHFQSLVSELAAQSPIILQS